MAMVSIYGVLEKWAAKQEAPATDSPEKGERGATSVQSRRYYFYEAPPENSIKFTALNQILSKDSPEKEAIVKKLEGGNTGRMFADYFVWKAVAVRTNKYSPDGRTFVVYFCKLTPFGGKVQGSEVVVPKRATVTPETIENDMLLFDDKGGNSDIINLDKTSESVYIDRDAPQDAATLVVKNVVPAGNKQPYEEFVKKFDDYRIWVPNIRQLMLPDFEKPTHDSIKGHYVGGEKAFKEQVEPYISEQPSKEPSEQGEMGEDETKPEEQGPGFRPGTKPTTPTKGEVVEEGDSALKTAYDIREAARRVVAQVTSTAVTPSTSTTTTQTTGGKSPSVPISPDPKTNQQSAKMLQDLARMQEKMKQTQQTVMRQTGTTAKY
jgi:hypothetical protein